jgi:hypothetical protein
VECSRLLGRAQTCPTNSDSERERRSTSLLTDGMTGTGPVGMTELLNGSFEVPTCRAYRRPSGEVMGKALYASGESQLGRCVSIR